MRGVPGFTGAGIDRADHLRLDADAVSALASSEAARLMMLAGHDPILDQDGRLVWGHVSSGEAGDMIFLGRRDAAALFAPLGPVETGKLGFDLFNLVQRMPADEAALWGTARSLIEWHGKHPFCSACGHRSAPFRSGWGRRCGACRAEHFPRVDPVVIMLAEHDGQVLVGRQPRWPAGRYSALAGFVEPGESIEEAVARELQEEAGVRATEVHYVASQPWPFPGQLMIACVAPVAAAELTLDSQELEDAMWVTREEVEASLTGARSARFGAPPAYAIAHSLLAEWAAGRTP